LALKVSRDWPDLPIVLITGFAQERQRAHNLEALVHSIVPKPFDLRTICDVVEEALEAGKRRD
jgi:CheY-like chemotaxis protein